MQTHFGGFTAHENHPTSSSVTLPLTQEGMHQTMPTTTARDDVTAEPADTSAIQTVDPSRIQASAGTDVDDPGEVRQEFPKMNLCIGKLYIKEYALKNLQLFSRSFINTFEILNKEGKCD